jgi:hypothetical protein
MLRDDPQGENAGEPCFTGFSVHHSEVAMQQGEANFT